MSGRLARAVAGKRIVVTGASSGIGRTTALKLGRAGATLIVVARRAEELDGLAAGIGDNAHAYPTDLADPEAVDRFTTLALDRHGGVDVLINNAGRSIRRSVAKSYDRIHDYERTMQLNYFGALRLTLAFLPGMRERGDGHVVNVSTLGALLNAPGWSAYLASKAALDAFARSMAPEVIGDGVHVTSVYMPLVRTPMTRRTRFFDGIPALRPEQAADMIARALVTRPREVTPFPGTAYRLLYPLTAKTADRLAGAAARRLPPRR